MYRILLIGVLICCISCTSNKAIVQHKTPESTPSSPEVAQRTHEEEVPETTPQVNEEVTETVPTVVASDAEKEQTVAPVKDSISSPNIAQQKTLLDTIPSQAFDHSIWNDLLQKHVSSAGIVNYKGFKRDRTKLKTYQKALSAQMPEATWTTADKLAYWMNVYNAFTIQLIIDNYPVASIKDIKDPWDLRFFKLGKKWYTLNEVEHKILRKMGDPRIHFGINCASFSCPPLLNKAFTAENVDTELNTLAIRFINDPLRNSITPNTIRLSKIFSWFAKDFKTKGSLIDFLNQYSKVTINAKAKKSFLTYNWKLNE